MKYKIIAEWSNLVKNFNKTTRAKFLKREHSEKKKGYKAYYDMVRSRTKFKISLKLCKKNEENIRNEIIENLISNNNYKVFFKGN